MEQRVERRLYRSRKSRVLAGVCGGLAEYFNIDPVLVRVLTILVILGSSCLGIIAYILLAILVPSEK